MVKQEKNDITGTVIRKFFCIILAVYALLVVSFYFLAGDQLQFRASRGNISMPAADAAAAELSEGVVVEQYFHAPIQRLERISVQWGSYYRQNSGTVTVQLLLENTGNELMSGSFDVATIGEGDILTIDSTSAIEVAYEAPLVLRLFSDSKPGCAVTPMVSSTVRNGCQLFVNGEPAPGILCFSAEGTDYIWTGLHYWVFAAGLGVLLMLMFVVIWLRWQNGNHSYVVNAFLAVKKYRFLIRQLVGRDFKAKYKRSVLGVFWSFLNPLLMMLVQYFVFSTLFRSNIPNYAAYLITGTVMFNFFSESCGMTLVSIIGNSSLITKVYMPKYIYPLTRTMSSVVNLAISLIPMMIVCLASGVHLHKATILSFFFFFCLIIFCLGLGMLLATSMVFFRDTQFLWGVLSMMWMYATPIFYPESILPPNLRSIIHLNPLYHFIANIRLCILSGISPEPRSYFLSFMIAVLMLLMGAFVFYKNQDKFVLYL